MATNLLQAAQEDERRKAAALGQPRPNSFGDAAAVAPAPVAAPAANIQTGQPRSVSPSALYMQDRAQELKDQVGQGNYAQAAGTAARTAVQGLGMYGIELADKAGTPLINAARGFGSGLLGSDANATPATPSTIASPPTSQTNPAAAPASTSLANAGRGVVNPPTINPSAPAPPNAPAAAPEVMPGVFRHGRVQYSDNAGGMGFAPGFTGQPTAQNDAAWQRLADRSQADSMARVSAQQPAGFTPTGMQAPTVRHSGNDWQSRNDLRNAMVSATSIMNDGGKWDKHGKGVVSPERAYAAQLAGADAQLRGAQPGVDVAAMRENAGIQRTGMQETGANQRSLAQRLLEQQKINQAGEAQGIANRGASLIQGMREQVAAEQDPAKRKSLVQRLREAQGQTEQADPYLVVPGGQQVDENGKPYNMPSSVFNRQTQQFVQQPRQAGAAPIGENAQAIAIRDNPSLSREQKVEALRRLGYS